MRIKTMIIILITVLLTVILMQNTGTIYFSFLWADVKMSKLLVLAGIAVVAFILGLMVGRPKRVKRLGGDDMDGDPERKSPDTLSDEDREYIS